MLVNYADVTELPGLAASKEQLERIFHRYHFARQFSQGKEVLEVACGAGIGLGYLRSAAKRITGVDIESENLEIAAEYYKESKNIEIKLMDAHRLTFENHAFDLVILYEAIYYLENPGQFIREAYRVLRQGGGR